MIWFDRLILGLAWLAAVLFTVAGVMLTYEVLARYFFIRPTIWAAELSQLCLIWGCLIGMAWLLSARRHIAVDAVIQLLPPGAQRWIEAAAMLVVAAFSAMVTWKGWDIFLDSFERGRTTGSLLDLPSWVVELAVPLGFALLFIQALIEAVRSLRGTGADREIAIE
ncbi:Tripartite ATP-independent periplasmic transporters, DctQ component [Roseovarius gaetbuli]|uniref:TRAP transporter small permease protein n=1 Tax=Roseovarius gaetbuli TaxID=1356575 RepID=A0A1X6ZXX6_9RHOB|nr:TRAP transporter small permease [Roseovarius gaetbuli]SLN64972.1 Tripartite ATP-independent periplasmic transporters, DctQ component [Roseovarius gaetbuli]